MGGITNPAEKYFKDGLWTFDGGVWRPQNQLLAYRNTIQLSGNIGDSAAGNITINLSSVPAGEVWVVTSIIGWDSTSATTYILIGIVGHLATVYLDAIKAPASITPVRFIGQAILGATEYIQIIFAGVTLHDVLVANASGYKFLIAE